MNPVVETIMGRRSVREGYSQRPVPREVLADVVRCGLAAPSAKNSRPWRFTVVTDRAVLEACACAVENAEGADTYIPVDPATGLPRLGVSSSVHASAAILRSVPAAVFVENAGVFSGGRATLLRATPAALGRSIVTYTFEAVGLGAAVQNLWVAAASYGMVGVFLGDLLVAEQELRDRLGIAGDLVGALALGYLATDRTPLARDSDAQARGRVRWIPPG